MVSTVLPRAIYAGTFVHNKSPTELDICVRGAIGVDEKGKIAFVKRDVEDYDSLKTLPGWEQAKITVLTSTSFFFPGFIGLFTQSSPAFCAR
jgi:guanine deaminase